MKKKIAVIAALCLVLIISGCIDTETVISVKKDGSGTVTQTTFFDRNVQQMMEGMGSMFGGGDDADQDEAPEPPKDDSQQYLKKAQELGEGVTFVSAEEVTKDDGSTGTKIVYAFTDISKLRISPSPDVPMGDGMPGDDDEDEDAEEEEPIRFSFKKGANPSLTVHMPRSDEGADEPETDAEEDLEDAMPDGADMGLAMMRPLMEGMRLRVVVELADGKIKSTNAAHVGKHNGRDAITLLEMEMREIMKNDQNLTKFKEFEKAKNHGDALAKMQDLPGFKAEPSEKVEISIK